MKSFSTVALLPLDGRPPNYDFPRQLAEIAGVDLLLPPRELLGNLQTPAQRDSLERWLLRLPRVDALLASLDVLAYGGLAQSRQNRESLDDATTRLKVLLEWREANRDTPLYAFNAIMRLGITMDSDATSIDHFNLQRYARLTDEAAAFRSSYLQEQLAEVTAQIAPEVRTDYHAARERNHAVNLWAIEQAAAGNIDFLSLVQEDCAEFGLHRAEQKELLDRAAQLQVQNISLHPGTDEAAMVLLARLLKTKNTFTVHWSRPQGPQEIPPFEDRPIAQTLHAQLSTAHCSEAEDGDFALFINAPVGFSRERPTAEEAQEHQQRLIIFVQKMQDATERGQRVALCDAAFPNGADDALMTLLDKRNLFGKLSAFAAWNTASNALGTIIAQCCALAAGGFEKDELNARFVLERIVDDWLYQTRLRPQIQKRARELGVSTLRLGEQEDELRRRVERELRGYSKLIAQRHFHLSAGKLHVSFPWHRTFEIALHFQR